MIHLHTSCCLFWFCRSPRCNVEIPRVVSTANISSGQPHDGTRKYVSRDVFAQKEKASCRAKQANFRHVRILFGKSQHAFSRTQTRICRHFKERPHRRAAKQELPVGCERQATINDVLSEHHGRTVRVCGSLSNRRQHQCVHKRHQHRHQRLYHHQQQWQRQQQHAYTHRLLVTTETMCADFIHTHNNQPSRWTTARMRDGSPSSTSERSVSLW